MADYHHGFARLQRFASPHNLLDQRSSTGAVQHLCQTGLQPRAFAGRENHNGEIIVGHSFEPFCGSGGYFATEGCSRRSESLISGGDGGEGGQVGFAFGEGRFARRDGPERGVIQEAADKLGMQRMAGLMGFDAGQQRQAR